jgi:hypothetical protein
MGVEAMGVGIGQIYDAVSDDYRSGTTPFEARKTRLLF